MLFAADVPPANSELEYRPASSAAAEAVEEAAFMAGAADGLYGIEMLPKFAELTCGPVPLALDANCAAAPGLNAGADVLG
jgi:hypothetical protein